MGMFDKDKEIGIILQNWAADGEPFILWNARILREDFPTNLGPAVQAGLSVSKMDNPNDRYDVTTLASAIAAKVREADVTDFPAVVQTAHVESKWGRDALVLSFLKPYNPRGERTQQATPATTPTEPDEIPF